MAETFVQQGFQNKTALFVPITSFDGFTAVPVKLYFY